MWENIDFAVSIRNSANEMNRLWAKNVCQKLVLTLVLVFSIEFDFGVNMRADS